MTDDELTGFLVEDVSVLVDDLSGDVGLHIDGGHLLILSPGLAEELARDLFTATRREPRGVSSAKWVQS